MNGCSSSISTSSVRSSCGSLDVDERVARVVEDAEVAVDAHVDARRLEQRSRRTGRCRSRPPRGAGGSSGRRDHRRFSSGAALLRPAIGCASSADGADTLAMALTRAIQLETAIPGPRSREILRAARHASSPSRSRSTSRSWSRRRAARRSPTSTATRSSTSPAASAASTSATRTRASSRRRRSSSSASRTPTSRSSRTRSTSTLAERLIELAPIARPGEGGVLQRRHRGGRERGQVRARVHEAARR